MQEIETELKISLTKRFKNFFLGVRREVVLITWPTQVQLKKYTKLVIISTFACGFCVYLVDLASKTFLDGLRNLVRIFLT